jgi:hypothetical protein
VYNDYTTHSLPASTSAQPLLRLFHAPWAMQFHSDYILNCVCMLIKISVIKLTMSFASSINIKVPEIWCLPFHCYTCISETFLDSVMLDVICSFLWHNEPVSKTQLRGQQTFSHWLHLIGPYLVPNSSRIIIVKEMSVNIVLVKTKHLLL